MVAFEDGHQPITPSRKRTAMALPPLRLCRLALPLLLCAGTAASQAMPLFQATMLALPGGMDSARGWAIHDGVVVGQTSSSGGGAVRATVWQTPGQAQFLDSKPSPFDSAAYAISANGIAGYQGSAFDATSYEALRWANAAAAAALLGSAGGGATAYATAGAFTAGSLDAGAFLFNGSTLAMLGGAGSVAYGVSANGLAVGVDEFGAAVVFDGTGGALRTLAASGSARAILDDLVIGSFDDANFAQRAFLSKTDGSGFTELFNGVAYGLNASGLVVGADFDANNGFGLAMLYDGSAAADLNTLILGSGLDGFTLTQARGIDEHGNIVAFGVRGDEERAFLLRISTSDPGGPTDPGGPGNGTVPEPASAALVLLALAAMMTLKRRVHRPLPALVFTARG
jgi:hypothetical protein